MHIIRIDGDVVECLSNLIFDLLLNDFQAGDLGRKVILLPRELLFENGENGIDAVVPSGVKFDKRGTFEKRKLFV